MIDNTEVIKVIHEITEIVDNRLCGYLTQLSNDYRLTTEEIRKFSTRLLLIDVRIITKTIPQ